jgi:hypothetical protein
MARVRQARKDDGKDSGKPKKPSKEAREKMIAQLTSQLAGLQEQVLRWAIAPDSMDVGAVAQKYSLFLESPAETRKPEVPGAKPDPKKAARDDEKTAPVWDYGVTTEGLDLGDLPAFSALAQMRLHLAEEAEVAAEQLAAPGVAENRDKLLDLLGQRLEDDRKTKRAKLTAGGDVSEDAKSAAAAPRPLPAAVALGIQAIFSFLAGEGTAPPSTASSLPTSALSLCAFPSRLSPLCAQSVRRSTQSCASSPSQSSQAHSLASRRRSCARTAAAARSSATFSPSSAPSHRWTSMVVPSQLRSTSDLGAAQRRPLAS